MSGVLKFKIADVRRLMAGSDASKPLNVVGDHGVYLMSFSQAVGSRDIVYAERCNPDVNDMWYDVKGRIFGYDDGSDEIGSPKELQNIVDACVSHLIVRFTSKSVHVQSDRAVKRVPKVDASKIPANLRHLIKG